MHDVLELVISNFAQLGFGIDALLMYAGLIVVSTVLFYAIDTPWRKTREAEDKRQKARDKARLEVLKTNLKSNIRYTKKYAKYLLAKRKRDDEIYHKWDEAIAKREQRERQRQIEIEKCITREALYRAEIQRQALKEVVGEKQAALTKIDLDLIKQQIHAELLAAAQHAANCELTDEIVNAICAPRVGFIVGI